VAFNDCADRIAKSALTRKEKQWLRNGEDLEREDAGGKKLPFKDTLSANTKQVGEVESWNEDLEIEVRDEDGAINYCPLTWKSIGFTALACRIQSLRKLEGNLQIVDLDNEYYLSISFSMKDLHLSHIVVWVRLPGLPYKYYNKDLFRAIAGVIGQAVKIDYNTIVGRRGKFCDVSSSGRFEKTIDFLYWN
ncbi:hypothetical protein Goshw_001843, partial [Gossypium schwendimanii]|nr:hypothetical protein [Gossypium schwendimanii]